MESQNRSIRLKSPYAAQHTLRKGLSFFGVTFVVATAGYVLAGWEWLDAFYMVTITIFGVGFGEVRPIETPALKFFTMGVIAVGCSSLIYVIGGIVQLLTEGEISRMLGGIQRSREIDHLDDHTIICGYGRVGQILAKELASNGQKVVILDCNSDRVGKAIADGFLAFQGNAVEDDALRQAGIFRARTLATVLPDDAVNVFITLTARELSETITIISRAENPGTERKLMRSGASHVVMPSAIGAERIAQLATFSPNSDSEIANARFDALCTRHIKPTSETVDFVLAAV